MGNPDDFREPTFQQFINAVISVVDKPVTWFRENVVVPNRPSYNWYHLKLRRVPTIDQCYTDDIVCYTEANEQYKRDKLVDGEIIKILRNRFEQCYWEEAPDNSHCRELKNTYDKAAENYFTKYGDLGVFGDVRDCYMKQKHRLIWERRHGPVGSGMKPREEWGNHEETA